MFFFETCKLFFDKNSNKDLFGLIAGLLAVFTFANVMMPDWPFMFFSAAMIFSTALYRFVMVNDNFAKNDIKVLKRNNIIDFVISKNAFVLLFSTVIFILVMISSSIFDNSFLNISFFIELLGYNFFVLGSENIIYIFHNKPVKGYPNGFKRNEIDDIQTGIKNFIDQIPSLIAIVFFVILFFVLGYNPSIYLSMFYHAICMITLIYFKKRGKNKSNPLSSLS